MKPQVFAHPAPAMPQNKGAVLIDRMHVLREVMRKTADYMMHCPDPAPRHAQELFGAAEIVKNWIYEAEDDWK